MRRRSFAPLLLAYSAGLRFSHAESRPVPVMRISEDGWGDARISDLRAVLQELRSLEAMLLAPPAAQQPTLQPTNPALHVLIKDADGKRWLIVANDSRRAEETTIEFGATPDADARNNLGEGSATLSIRSGKAAVKMPPLARGWMNAII